MNLARHSDADRSLTVQWLRPVELGKHKALLAGIMRQADSRAIPDRMRALDIPYRLLSDTEALAPQTVTDVLASPQFGAWANDALHCLLEDMPTMNGVPREVGLGRLALFAATAAVRAGISFDMAVPFRDGTVSFPTLGTARLDSARLDWGRAWLDGTGGHVQSPSTTVDIQASGTAENWFPLPRVTVVEEGLCLDVMLDHSDPFLGQYDADRSRVDGSDLPRWQHLFTAGWRILARDHQALASLVADAVRTVVPLVAPDSGRRASGTGETAFGAIAMSLPADELDMAETLVHESHHAVLGALRDIQPLIYDDGHGQGQPFAGYAPWRDDPRPAHALLQGVYAHYGMGQFWRREYLAGAAARRERAAIEFGRMRTMTARGARSLAGSGLLTGDGQKILTDIEDEVARWHDEPLPTAVERHVAELTRAHEDRWRARWLAGT